MEGRRTGEHGVPRHHTAEAQGRRTPRTTVCERQVGTSKGHWWQHSIREDTWLANPCKKKQLRERAT